MSRDFLPHDPGSCSEITRREGLRGRWAISLNVFFGDNPGD
jgi:hypothetical protein